MACHDGTVAVDSFAKGGTMTAGTTTIGGTWNVGTNLGNDHPVGFSYDTSDAADTGIVAFASVSTSLQMFGATNTVECSTCHDVHNQGTLAGEKLLPITLTGSAICLECHIK